jgi:hypothetical protein
MLRLVRLNPFWALLIPVWLTRGRAFLKRQIASRVTVDPATLPYNKKCSRFCASRKRLAGRCTGDGVGYGIGQAVERHLGLFDEVLASNGQTNLRGAAKGAALVERFGERGFDYAGNSHVDLAVGVAPGTLLLPTPGHLWSRELKSLLRSSVFSSRNRAHSLPG